jgi:hypothetical protein
VRLARLNGSAAPGVAVLADAVVQDLNLVAVQQPPAVNLFSVFTHPCIFLWGEEDDRYGINTGWCVIDFTAGGYLVEQARGQRDHARLGGL